MNITRPSVVAIQKWSLVRLYESNKDLKIFAKRASINPHSWRLYIQIEGCPGPGVFSTDTRKTREWRTLDSLVRFVYTTLPEVKNFEVIMQ